MFFASTENAGREWDPPVVLVASADAETRELLCHCLQEKGHEVLLAGDGEQAWFLFASRHPRLVITDVRLPQLDGLGLCLRIREDRPSPYSFILVLTSCNEPEVMAQGFAAGADDFMTKPIDRTELTWRLYSGLRVLSLHNTLENRIEQLDEAHTCLQQANDEMHAGLLAAANTQRALLPQAAPDVRNVDCAWSYHPSEHLGGDSLNVFRLDEHRLGFFVADVCGHGLPSALLTVTLHRVLTPVPGHAGLLTSDDDECPLGLFGAPGRVLTEVNRRFPMQIETGEYFTLVYGVLDTRTGNLRYAGAGHPHPILLSRDRSAARLATSGFPIGFVDDAVYETETVQLRPGDRLCVFSDGATEARSEEGTMYGAERILQSLQDRSDVPVAEAVDCLASEINEWTGMAPSQDDVALILLQFAGKCSQKVVEPRAGDPVRVKTG